jgi:glycosyltransferase involved in cell wall biosynthesis
MIYIVSTEIQQGRGGISTALVGYREAESLKEQAITFVSSHCGKQKLSIFIKAWVQLSLHANKNDVVWLHCGNWFSILRKCVLSFIPKLRSAKVVFHFHAQAMDGYLEHWLMRFFIKFLCFYANGIVLLTPWWQKRFIDVFPEYKNKFSVVPNPLDESLTYAAREKNDHNIETKNIKLLAMSRLVPGKGFEAAIRTLTQLPSNYSLSIAGDGPLMSELKELSKSLGLMNRITFLGWVDYKQKIEVLKQHHIFLLPSKYDSFGMGFIEAMAFGLPVVALRFQATPDVVIHNETGVLCDNDHAIELANAVVICVSRYSEMSPACKNHVLTLFDKDLVVLKALDFFRKI